MLLGDRLDHVLEERVPVGGLQGVVILPVHLELAVGVLMIVLIGAPAEIEHGIADLGDDVVAAHQRLLVVAGLRLVIARVGDGAAVGRDQEELAFDAGLQLVALAAAASSTLFKTLRGACSTSLPFM